MNIEHEIESYDKLKEKFRSLVEEGMNDVKLSPSQAIFYAQEYCPAPYKPYEVYVIRQVAFAIVAFEYGVIFDRTDDNGVFFLDEFGRKYNECNGRIYDALDSFATSDNDFKVDLQKVVSLYKNLF